MRIMTIFFLIVPNYTGLQIIFQLTCFVRVPELS